MIPEAGAPKRQFLNYVRRLKANREERSLRKRNASSSNAYAQSLLCVHRVWERLEERLQASFGVDEETVSAMFDEVWEELEPKDHPWKEDYRSEALSMVGQTLVFNASGTRVLRPNWTIKLQSGDVIIRPDYAEVDESASEPSVLMQDMCFGSFPSRPPSKDLYALHDMAAEEAYPKSRRAGEGEDDSLLVSQQVGIALTV